MGYGVKVGINFTDTDVRDTMPHLKGVMSAVALESIETLLISYLEESGHEIMWQLLKDDGWDIGGTHFIEMGGW